MKAHTQRLLLAMMLLIATGSTFAQEDVPATPEQPDTVVARPKPDLMHRIGNFFTRYFKDFNEDEKKVIFKLVNENIEAECCGGCL